MTLKFVQNRLEILALVFLLIVALALRTYRLDNPIADWHAFRQADTASVTREYVKSGIDLLRPKYHDHSNIQSGLDNPEGYRMVEFPLINGLIAWILRQFPKLDLVIFSRFTAASFSLGTLLFLYFFIKKISSTRVAWLSALFFATLPFSVYYSRVTLPEPFLLFFLMGSLWSLTKSLESKKSTLSHWGWGIFSAVMLGLAFLLKPSAVFFAPVYLVLIWQKQGFKAWQDPLWYFFGLIAVLPFWEWRQWIQSFPEGIPALDWLFNSDGIRFRPAWFRWLFYERLTKLILGYVGVIFLPLVLIRPKKELALHVAWWLGILAYLSILATGNVRHDYYQVLLVPALCFALGSGAAVLLEKGKKYLGLIAVLVFGGGALFFSWQELKGYYSVNHWEYVRAGRIVDQTVPKEARVIAPAFGDTIFLFQTNRTGWPIGFEIKDKIQKGATHYVTTSFDDEARELEQQYQTLFKNEEVLLLDLGQPQ